MTEASIRRAVRLANQTLGKKKKRRHFDDGGDTGGGDGPSSDRDSGWGGWGGDNPRADSLSQSEQASADRSYSAPDRDYSAPERDSARADSVSQSEQESADRDYSGIEASDRGGGDQPSMFSRAMDVINQVVGITPAEAEPVYSRTGVLIGQKPSDEEAQAEQAKVDAARRAGQFISATGNVYPGSTPPALQTDIPAAKSPFDAYNQVQTVPTGFGSGRGVAGPIASDVALQQQIDQANLAENQAQAAIDAANMRSAILTGTPLAQPAGTFTSAYELARAAGTPTSGYDQLAQAAGTYTSPYELARAAGTPTSGYDTLAQAAGTPTAGYNQLAQAAGTYTTPYELARAAGTPTAGYEPKASGFDAASAAAQLGKLTTTDAALRAARDAIKQNLGTDQASTGATTGAKVPSPDARVPMPPIPYRDLGQGNFVDNILKVFGMDTESWINNKAAQYEKQGMSPSDAAIQASYDLRDIQLGMKNREGGGGGDRQASVAPIIPQAAAATLPTQTTDSGAKLPGVAVPYVPPGRKPYTSTAYNYGSPSYVSDLGAAESIRRQAQYNEAVRNALRLIG